MLRFRTVWLWLLMLALPLQGYAAAAMALCHDAGPQASVVVVGAPAPDLHSSGHGDARAHGGHHGDATADSAAAGPHHADAAGGTASDDGSHACKACSACAACHAVALQTAAPADPGHFPPGIGFAEQSPAPAFQAQAVPDKPPRV